MMTNASILRARAAPWIVPAAVLLIWQALSMTGVISGRVLPAPVEVGEAAAKLATNGRLLSDIAVSTRRAAVGFLIGGTLGFLLGLINGSIPLCGRLFDSSMQMMRTIPHLALIPLVILWFG
ncbi:MAG: aliphatic sulfonate ABC transporter permease SsuC, partial [Thermomicrobiales bacterium]